MNLQKIFEDAGYDTCSYSGRGMYNKECLGITFSGSVGSLFSAALNSLEEYSNKHDPNKVFLHLTKDDAKKLASAFSHMLTDNMGMDSIAYFPSVEYVGEEEGE